MKGLSEEDTAGTRGARTQTRAHACYTFPARLENATIVSAFGQIAPSLFLWASSESPGTSPGRCYHEVLSLAATELGPALRTRVSQMSCSGPGPSNNPPRLRLTRGLSYLQHKSSGSDPDAPPPHLGAPAVGPESPVVLKEAVRRAGGPRTTPDFEPQTGQFVKIISFPFSVHINYLETGAKSTSFIIISLSP